MDGYELGKDIQEIKERLSRIEATLGAGAGPGVYPLPAQEAARGIDGGVDITNVRREGDKICGDVRVHAHASALGKTFDYDKTWNHVCIQVGSACFTLFEGGIGPADGKVEVCYEDGKICVELTIEVFTLKGHWKQCKGVG